MYFFVMIGVPRSRGYTAKAMAWNRPQIAVRRRTTKDLAYFCNAGNLRTTAAHSTHLCVLPLSSLALTLIPIYGHRPAAARQDPKVGTSTWDAPFSTKHWRPCPQYSELDMMV